MKRFIVTLAAFTTIVSGLSVSAAQAATSTCTITATGSKAAGIIIAASKGCGTEIPEVSASLYLAHNISGNPISDQVWVSGDDVDVPPFPDTVTVHFDSPVATCLVQIDVAYGPTHKDLSIPYGSKLIQAFHSGETDCTIPSPTPSTTTPTATTPAPTPSVTVTTPPVTTTPAPTTKPVKPTPTHSVTPTPTDTNPGKASGCVGTGCNKTLSPKPTPSATPVDELPMTGVSNMGIFAIVGGLLLVIGIGLLFSVQYFRRKNLIQ